jgi:enterochelin esterase-like enzyme
MTRLGASPLWARRDKLERIDQAMLTLFAVDNMPLAMGPETLWRGPNAPPPPPVAKPLKGRVVETELLSQALGESRALAIYLPPGWSREKTWPVLYMTDSGGGQFAALVEAMIDLGQVRPLIIVSAASATNSADGSDLRAAEYIPGMGSDPARFDRHMRFFAEEMVAVARREYGASPQREDAVVAGFSNGAVFSLLAGLRHPETFGAAVVMSPGVAGLEPGDLKLTPRARFRLSGGLYEAGFKAAAEREEKTLRDAGFDVKGRYLAAGHSPDQWDVVLQGALAELFPPLG